MPARRDRWVVCAEYAAGPFTADQAARKLEAIAVTGCCQEDHEVITSAAKPKIPASAWPEDDSDLD